MFPLSHNKLREIKLVVVVVVVVIACGYDHHYDARALAICPNWPARSAKHKCNTTVMPN